MRLKVKRKNMARFASLSALGAGAMVLTTGTADASIIHVVVDQTIGGGCCGTMAVQLPGSAGFVLAGNGYSQSSHRSFLSTIRPGPYRLVTATVNRGTVHRSVFLAPLSSLAFGSRWFSGQAWGKGQAWGSVNRTTNFILAAKRYSHFSRGRIISNGLGGGTGLRRSYPFHHTYTSQSAPFESRPYFLFRFNDNGSTLYGWGQLSEFIDTSGPEVTLVDYAYDTTGAFLPAGTTGAPVPEPAETIPLALSALVLGAAGVRRWRAAKAA